MRSNRWLSIAAVGAVLALSACGASSSAAGKPKAAGNATATTIAVTTTAGHKSGSHDMAGVDTKAVDDRGFSKLENGMQHGHGFPQAISKADRVLLAHQLLLARETALKYPTVKDALAAGLHRAGPFSPGLGAHYIQYANGGGNSGGPMTDDDIRKPLAWIYDGNHPDSHVAGLFYMSASQHPQGFAGTNDVWHVHHDICIVAANGSVDTPLGADHSATKAECDVVKGSLLKQTQLLLHVWVVPGYESPEGVFSHLSSTVTCDDGSYNVIEVTKIGKRLTACVDGTE